ncbi:PGA5 [Symbiodinium natans]|uniref:PGA5 protein n=1 Tax=Symbiodinium natans TaxID=878477 RepID=A0A812PQQ2_9DINO|nr:PGA5 [Symbiodinium natans]
MGALETAVLALVVAAAAQQTTAPNSSNHSSAGSPASAQNDTTTTAADQMTSSLHPVVIRGNLLYDSVTGHRFFAKGVAYNPRNGNYGQVLGTHKAECIPGQPKFPPLPYFADPAADDMEEQFKDYLPLIANLGANVVRLYNIDPEKSHRKFMEQAASLGLYVMVPLTRGDWGFLPALPSPQCYFEDLPDYGHVGLNLLTSAKLIVDQFSQYENTFMFVVGNEIDHLDRQGFAAYPCVKALTRDIHRYQKAEGYRRVPLIYSNKDQGGQDRLEIGEYLACELESPDDAVDAFGLNVYSWCDPEYHDETGAVNFRWSPYQEIVRQFGSFSKPFLFTEFGCNIGSFKWECPDYQGGRTWIQLSVMADRMIDFVSGAVAFEFSMENNEFGLVMTPGFLKGQNDIKLTDSYFALQRQFRQDIVKNMSQQPTPREKTKCISRETAFQLQYRQHVGQASDWTVLPETPLFPETTLLP